MSPDSINKTAAVIRRSRRGLTLVELIISVTIMGILMSIAAPSFQRAVVQSRADIAAANLRAIWSAERCYWLDHRTYTDDLAELTSLGLLDPTIAASSTYFVYAIGTADQTSFVATVTRTPGSRWSGQFVIDQTGIVTGSIDAMGESSLVPGFQ